MKRKEERDYLSVFNKSFSSGFDLNGYCCLGINVNIV